MFIFFFFQAEDGIRDFHVTGVQTCALPISLGFQGDDVYLRTALTTDIRRDSAWGYVRLPDYRWGVFLLDPDPERRISHGEFKGQPVWREVPGEFRNPLRRLIVVQGDTEPASVEQQRHLGHT